ncbi:MAG: hypothetical protein U0694_02080 [Anaerolineae bacterium]
MADVFTDMLHSWQNFYFMAGGAAAALIGLMFVAMSLGMHLISDTTRELGRFFILPSILYFVSVLILCCVMLNPAFSPTSLALVLFLGGLAGLGVTWRYVRQLIQIAKKYQDFDRGDWLAQVVLPVVNYTLIVAAALCCVISQWEFAFSALWIATILLLLSAIANTWSLVMWIVEQRVE